MKEFCMALEDSGLNDLGYIGRWFTWERGRFLATNIRERLDRGVATLNWMNLFPGYQLEHLSHSFSDHCPILLDTTGPGTYDRNKQIKTFRFEAKWCLENSFEEMVRKWWKDIPGGFLSKLDRLGFQMQQWNPDKFKEEKRTRVDLENRLNYLYSQDPSDEILADIVEAQLGINMEADKEEVFWEQRIRVNWLKMEIEILAISIRLRCNVIYGIGLLS